jgi:hypothetical protein
MARLQVDIAPHLLEVADDVAARRVVAAPQARVRSPSTTTLLVEVVLVRVANVGSLAVLGSLLLQRVLNTLT